MAFAKTEIVVQKPALSSLIVCCIYGEVVEAVETDTITTPP